MWTRCPAPGTSVSSRPACGHRALGRLRCFDRVNVVVIRAGVIRVALHHALERGDDRVGARLRRAVLLVEPPRTQVHQALGVERRDIEIVGKASSTAPHRRPSTPARAPSDRRSDRRRSACRAHQPAPAPLRCRRRLRFSRFSEVRVALLQPLGRRDVVDVGAERQRHAPVRHGRRRIERRGRSSNDLNDSS